MTVGILLKTSNSIYFWKQDGGLAFFFECIPQFLFMMCMFGYMDFLIFYKWGMDWDAIQATGEGPPPSLINVMIAMPLGFGGLQGQYPLYGDHAPNDNGGYISTGFGQKKVQQILVSIAFLT